MSREGKTIFVKDGDSLLVFAEIDRPSVMDPCGNYSHVVESYRVVAQLTGPTLVLVPVGEGPVEVAEADVNRLKAREAEQAAAGELTQSLELVKELLHSEKFMTEVRKSGYHVDIAAIFDGLVKASGWKI
jgi:hypothetical protein